LRLGHEESGPASPEHEQHDGGAAGQATEAAPAADPGSANDQPGKTGDPGPSKRARTGRNLPVAIAVGAVLGGLAILTLFTIKATFLLYVGAVVFMAMWELSRALGSRGISLPLIPLTLGGVAMVTLGYWVGAKEALAALALTFAVLLAWRLGGSSSGYLRDVSASVFALAYLPLMALFVALMLATPNGDRRVLLFVILTVSCDTFAYFAGIAFGKHLLAPGISPKKTWEGLGGSAVACLAAGAIGLPLLLHGRLWQGLLLGAAAVAASTLGDLTESMMKRDLQIKDMGSLLPGHGGFLDRIDSLLMMAPVVWLLLAAFIPAR
jgi:phosphatidate cytidylyltransferase